MVVKWQKGTSPKSFSSQSNFRRDLHNIITS